MSNFIGTPNSITEAAYQLGRDGILSDPDTDTLLVAAAELCGSRRDLSQLDRHFVVQIVAAFDDGYSDFVEEEEPTKT